MKNQELKFLKVSQNSTTSILLLIQTDAHFVLPGYFGPFISYTSTKSIEREGLGQTQTGTSQEGNNTAVT